MFQVPEISADDLLTSPDKTGFLDRGNFGAVRLCLTKDLKEVVVKCYPLSGFGEKLEEKERKLKNEARIMYMLTHDHIVKTYGICLWTKSFGIVMEYLPGGNLDELLNKTQIDIPWWSRTRIALQLCKAISFLHTCMPSRVFVHGDIKPENILLTLDLDVKLADFGSVNIVKETGVATMTLDQSKTNQHTPVYTAPELLRNINLPRTAAMDTYSFGMVLYEIVTRTTVYKGAALPQAQVLQLICDMGQRPNLELLKQTKEAINEKEALMFNVLVASMKKCWSPKPEERPDLKEVQSSLAHAYKAISRTTIDEQIQQLKKRLNIKPKKVDKDFATTLNNFRCPFEEVEDYLSRDVKTSSVNGKVDTTLPNIDERLHKNDVGNTNTMPSFEGTKSQSPAPNEEEEKNVTTLFVDTEDSASLSTIEVRLFENNVASENTIPSSDDIKPLSPAPNKEKRKDISATNKEKRKDIPATNAERRKDVNALPKKKDLDSSLPTKENDPYKNDAYFHGTWEENDSLFTAPIEVHSKPPNKEKRKDIPATNAERGKVPGKHQGRRRCLHLAKAIVAVIILLAVGYFVYRALAAGCPKLARPANGGRFTCNNNETNCWFHCPSGYLMMENYFQPASNLTSCLSKSKTWSDPVPYCEKVTFCEHIQSASLSDNSYCLWRDTKRFIPINFPEVGYRNGSSCMLDCLTTHTLQGAKQVRCEGRSWVPSLPTCKIKECPPLQLSTFVETSCTQGFDIFSICSFSCSQGILQGPSSLTCGSSLKWSGSLPTCEACPKCMTGPGCNISSSLENLTMPVNDIPPWKTDFEASYAGFKISCHINDYFGSTDMRGDCKCTDVVTSASSLCYNVSTPRQYCGDVLTNLVEQQIARKSYPEPCDSMPRLQGTSCWSLWFRGDSVQHTSNIFLLIMLIFFSCASLVSFEPC